MTFCDVSKTRKPCTHERFSCTIYVPIFNKFCLRYLTNWSPLIPDMSPDSKKPPRGLSRKRPGTGRRLPSLPTDKSPGGSQCSSRLSQSTDSQSPRCPSTPRYGENNNLDSAKSKTVTIANKVVNRFEDTDTETVSRTKFESDTDSVVKSVVSDEQTPKSSSSSRSVASVDTELLLKDTETVMAAMEARMESKHESHNGVLENGDCLSSDRRFSGDCLNSDRRFSDSESMVAMVNGDDDYEKPTQYESPRQNLAKNKGMKQHKPLQRMSSASARLQAFREKNYKRNSWTEPSVVSDVFSDNTELETATNRSDISAEDNESGASFSRSGSKGKGQITMTRPNRAFQLRRLKADGGDTPDTPSSGISGAVSLTNVSDSSKSLSIAGNATPTRLSKSTNRLSYPSSRQDSARSNNSLGATIAQRSRQGVVSDRSEASLGDQIADKAKRNSGNFVRSDGGRFSLKLNRSYSTQDSINSTGDSYSSPTRKPDFKAIKSRLKTTPSYGLSVTGMSSRSSTVSSQPSMSDSPKSAEKAAWKRRKEYDPRRAVAEAKAKAKECKVKTDSSGRVQGRMTRSASFTNTKELVKYRKEAGVKSDTVSVSSADDTSFASEVNDSYNDSGFQRGFVPYTGRSQSSRLFSASEDDEIGQMVRSAHVSVHFVRCYI